MAKWFNYLMVGKKRLLQVTGCKLQGKHVLRNPYNLELGT
ncbi:hypothetical protein Niako_5713 [Niastella koreensis GR20-10]|uniref:Uncharacterized protein n=1 Tax=Niastella koreensis (strain DSM 17620 / KACC 11465 / NBRC 106392 / GR20-10) TaxID=700598 RepID=G8TLA3_NIAKG|nr:hypothetical protein Niako_5713 [Niastella koreensis GR20-10]